MRWDRLFEDLEEQLASEWEAERAALDTEAERLRLSRVTLRHRVLSLRSHEPGAPAPVIELLEGSLHRGEIVAVGADWLAVEAGDSPGAAIIPFTAVAAVRAAHADILRSARGDAPAPALAERMTLGFVLRDIVRRRIAVTVHLSGGRSLPGTIDRAAADHLDLALHDTGAPRRAREVGGYRLVPFAAIAWVQLHTTAPWDGATRVGGVS